MSGKQRGCGRGGRLLLRGRGGRLLLRGGGFCGLLDGGDGRHLFHRLQGGLFFLALLLFRGLFRGRGARYQKRHQSHDRAAVERERDDGEPKGISLTEYLGESENAYLIGEALRSRLLCRGSGGKEQKQRRRQTRRAQ